MTSATNIPILGITMGDPSGIGPEIAIKALSKEEVYNCCNPLLVGDAATIIKTIELLKFEVEVNIINDISEALFNFGTIDVYDLRTIKGEQLQYGEVSAVAGNASFEAIKKVIELAIEKQLDATVTGPINKESINMAGHHFSGHTEIYAHYTKTAKYAMLLVHENLRVIHVSTHVSLRQACDLIKKDRIIEVIELLDDACKQFGINQPKIGVAGLNPHASDGGLFGDEEREQIEPAVKEAILRGFQVEGPVPADTLFSKAKGRMYDGCVAMYHDQGHIPFKMEGFVWDAETHQMKSVKGVNITLGLPIIRCSVDHGTAFDIAGKGVASPDAMQLAIQYATLLAQHKYKAR
jgi:4-hydroxythreonine-4-phosphate dehydrogenase